MDPPSAPSSLGAPHKKTDKPDKKGNSFKFTQIDGTKSGASSSITSGPFLVMCVLCVVCVTASVYSGWREAVLENRLNILENRVASMERQSLENVNVLVERFRREAEEHFKKRVVREVAATRSMLLGAHKRTTRDAPECICPAGKKFL
ncbi:hypothetical protein ILUMI_04897 [Ignelater luminosus]|uniref:Uncharacterized protein n=1 Tax=Ignelater luminosus TaxID=2038154 RepID=A0A8K0GKN7_IGNLU|nr:hypothetical protein ILUMI_04897 [Ignelater luminosus]